MSKGFLAMLDTLTGSDNTEAAMEDLMQAMESQDVADGNAFAAQEAVQEAAAFMSDPDIARGGPELVEAAPLEVQALAQAQEVYQGVQDTNAAASTLVETLEVSFMMPQQREYRKGGNRWQLMFEGVCSHCAHCGQPLTDSVSVERGIGPVCSKKGYAEEPRETDEVEAMLALAEFPDLMGLVTDRYKPQGARAIMNFLVKICSLNRRSPVHQACTDAIEALGFQRLASTLRESLATVEVKDSKRHEGSYEVWVKKTDFNYKFYNAIRQLPNAYFSKAERANLVPIWHLKTREECLGLPTNAYVDAVPAGEERSFPAKVWKLAEIDGVRKPVRHHLWDLITAQFAGLYVKTPKGVVKIKARQ